MLHFVVIAKLPDCLRRLTRRMPDNKQAADPVDTHPPRHDHAWLKRALRVALAIALLLYFLAIGSVLGLRYALLAPRPAPVAPASEKIRTGSAG